MYEIWFLIVYSEMVIYFICQFTELLVYRYLLNFGFGKGYGVVLYYELLNVVSKFYVEFFFFGWDISQSSEEFFSLCRVFVFTWRIISDFIGLDLQLCIILDKL